MTSKDVKAADLNAFSCLLWLKTADGWLEQVGRRSSRPLTPLTALCKKRTVNYWMHLRRPFECKTIEESAVSNAVVAPLALARDGSALGSMSLIRICSHMVQWDIEHCLSIAWEPHALASASRDLSLNVCPQKLFTRGCRLESTSLEPPDSLHSLTLFLSCCLKREKSFDIGRDDCSSRCHWTSRKMSHPSD